MRLVFSSMSALALAVVLTGEAAAQYGLYGAPDVLPLARGAPASGSYFYPQPVYSPAPVVPAASYTAAPAHLGMPAAGSLAAAKQKPMEMPAEPAPSPAPTAAPSYVPEAALPATEKSNGNLASQQMFAPDGGYNPGCYSEACSQFEEAACGRGGYECCDFGCRSPWYASVMALGMSRDTANGVWTTYQTNNLPNQLLKTSDVELPWQLGGEVRFGRRFCCDQWAVEASYWLLDSESNSQTITSTPSVGTPLIVDYVLFGADPAGDWFDGAAAHRVTRTNEVHNVELNVIRNGWIGDCDCDYSIDWLWGVRYFRFDEGLEFASVRGGYAWGNPDAEAYIQDQITNNLVGFQLGVNADYRLFGNLRFFCTPKFGIYNNHIRNDYRMFLGNGTVANPGASGVAGAFPVHSTKDQIAFLTEIDIGLDWQLTRSFGARIGYRVVAATGIGLADNQIPFYLVDIPEIADIDGNGDLILHGAFAGLTYNF